MARPRRELLPAKSPASRFGGGIMIFSLFDSMHSYICSPLFGEGAEFIPSRRHLRLVQVALKARKHPANLFGRPQVGDGVSH
jgi:hypothetical protein